ncbi:hypothetical protein D3C77_340400 [compost metagenome]
MQKSCDRAWRTDLADQIDFADINPQFQRGGGHQHLQFTALETLLSIQTVFLGQAAMVRGYRLHTQAFAQVSG